MGQSTRTMNALTTTTLKTFIATFMWKTEEKRLFFSRCAVATDELSSFPREIGEKIAGRKKLAPGAMVIRLPDMWMESLSLCTLFGEFVAAKAGKRLKRAVGRRPGKMGTHSSLGWTAYRACSSLLGHNAP